VATNPDRTPDSAPEHRIRQAGDQAVARREVLHAATQDLTATLEAPRGDAAAWVASARVAIARMQESLHTHAEEAEQSDGLLAEVVQWQPSFGPRVERMRREHRDLIEQAEALQEYAGQTSDPDDIHRAATALVDAVDRHRHRSTELVQDTYNLDVSTGD
jgi:hypothetical protein